RKAEAFADAASGLEMMTKEQVDAAMEAMPVIAGVNDFRSLEWTVSLRHSEDIDAVKSIFGEAEFSEMARDNNGTEYQLQISIKRVAIKGGKAA
ncbi:MAG: hypothetical protein RQ732_10720, partial [Methylophaga sp.]|nr:hypothetical protein [Methylophaga sp.]